MRNVLVTGTDGAAAQSIVKCLRMAKNYRIITVGIDPLCIGVYLGHKGYVVSTNWEKYKEELKEICKKENTEIIIPGSDIELEHFVKERQYYEKECPPILIDYDLVPIARDKYLTVTTLKKLGFETPKTWLNVDEVDQFPVIVKPRDGYGSNLLFKNVTQDLLEPLTKYIRSKGKEPIIQEQLEGPEYSCMTLNAKDGELLAVETALSVKKFGQSYKTIVQENKPLEAYVSEVSRKLKATGPLSIQLIQTTKGYRIFELNARFTGAQIIRAYAGQNGPDILIRNWLDGEKLYPQITKETVAFYYSDFGYLPIEDFKKVLRLKRTRKRMVDCPKYF